MNSIILQDIALRSAVLPLLCLIFASAILARDLPNPAEVPRGRELLGQDPTAWDMDESARAGALRGLADCGWASERKRAGEGGDSFCF